MSISRFLPWKDPRLAAGLALVAGGGLAGALLLGGDDTVPILRARQPIAAGSVLETSQFAADELPERVGDGYLRLGEIPDGALAAYSLEAGDLLAGSAVVGGDERVDLSVPLLANPPSTMGVGSTVSVWRVRTAQFDTDAEASQIAAGAVVVAIEEPSSLSGVLAQIRVKPDDVANILEVLGTQDGLVLVGETP